MIEASYNMLIWIDISIGIGISKIFSSVFGIKSIRKKWYWSTFTHYHWGQFQTHAFHTVPYMGPIVLVVTLHGW